jgi:hypothetical protein
MRLERDDAGSKHIGWSDTYADGHANCYAYGHAHGYRHGYADYGDPQIPELRPAFH